MAMTPDTWKRRRVFITGCTGLVGAWLTDWLVAAGADVVGLIRDGVPGSNFYRRGLDRRIVVVRGDIEESSLMERALNEYEIEVVFHLAAQTIVGIANHGPLSTLFHQHCRHLESARGGSAGETREGIRHGLERQGVRDARRAALHGRGPADRTAPL